MLKAITFLNLTKLTAKRGISAEGLSEIHQELSDGLNFSEYFTILLRNVSRSKTYS
jgi:hypothetical protein